MTRREPVDVPASILARLKNEAVRRGIHHQNMLGAFARERFLYRVGISPVGGDFVLKGAMLFALWGGPPHRPTVDIDLLGPAGGTAQGVEDAFRIVAAMACEEDAIRFDPRSVRASPIRGNAVYGGLRVRMEARIGKAVIPVQVDVGFGDAVTPPPRKAAYPTILDLPAPRIAVYPRETVIAEKVHAMAVLGLSNTRLKDLFDVRILAGTTAFDGETLGHAIAATFRRRRTDLPSDPLPVLSPSFRADPDKRRQWKAFVSRGKLAGSPEDLGEVLDELGLFLEPVLDSLARGKPFAAAWPVGGPWRRSSPRGESPSRR